jgi:hypothetical protein
MWPGVRLHVSSGVWLAGCPVRVAARVDKRALEEQVRGVGDGDADETLDQKSDVDTLGWRDPQQERFGRRTSDAVESGAPSR